MRESKEGVIRKEEEKSSPNIRQQFKLVKDTIQSSVGEDNKIEIAQVEIIKRKIERINRESSDKDSEEEEGSSDDDNSLENNELFSEERDIK